MVAEVRKRRDRQDGKDDDDSHGPAGARVYFALALYDDPALGRIALAFDYGCHSVGSILWRII
jgi:hypothetical protein